VAHKKRESDMTTQLGQKFSAAMAVLMIGWALAGCGGRETNSANDTKVDDIASVTGPQESDRATGQKTKDADQRGGSLSQAKLNRILSRQSGSQISVRYLMEMMLDGQPARMKGELVPTATGSDLRLTMQLAIQGAVDIIVVGKFSYVSTGGGRYVKSEVDPAAAANATPEEIAGPVFEGIVEANFATVLCVPDHACVRY
jgi:hypothetical protein